MGRFLTFGWGRIRVFFCRVKVALIAFSRATLFDYLNPWSDLRIALDNALPRIIRGLKEEIQVGNPLRFSHVSGAKLTPRSRTTPRCCEW